MEQFSLAQYQRLMQLQEEKKGYLQEILQITRRQAEMLAEEDLLSFEMAEELTDSLTRRQVQMDKIDGLHQELLPLMQSYRVFVSGQPAASFDAQAVDQIRAEIAALLEQTAALDQQNAARLETQMQQLAVKGKRASQDRKTIGLYQQYGQPRAAEFFDEKK